MNLSSPAAVSELLRRHSFLPAHKFGQNFLVDANILAKIVDAGALVEGDQVIEIGTGLGVLTRALADKVGSTGIVATVEKDDRLFPIHAETIPTVQYPQIQQIHSDALDLKLDELLSEFFSPSPRGIAVIANIPYNITSPIIAKFLEYVISFRVIVLLVQKEVGARLTAKPATSDYGAFTVFAQYYAEIDIVSDVSPRVFFPPPKVTSSIIRLRPRSTPPVQVVEPSRFFAIIRSAFGQRRKTISNALSSELLGWSKSETQSLLDYAGLDGQRRGETFSIAEFATLERGADALRLVLSRNIPSE